ncbi:hypothetical protein [Roseibium alexandrii]|uniref:hypothetical protein n=1 Tax=Roseibium alexandrii TaxID=388408 RepID=UPI0037526855
MQKSREQINQERDALYAKAKAAEEHAAVGRGMATAAAIIMRGWGETVQAKHVLECAGFEGIESLKDGGVDQYDIDALTPLFKQ